MPTLSEIIASFFDQGPHAGVDLVPIPGSLGAQRLRRKLKFEKGAWQRALVLFLLTLLGLMAFSAVRQVDARERRTSPARSRHSRSEATTAPTDERDTQGRRVVYKRKNVVDFDAMLLEGDIKNPNEFYFVHRPEEKFGSLVKKRKNFHKEMLRDSVMIR